MYKPLPLFIGLRYTRAKRRNHFISFISLISMLGIMLGVMALITVISVMNGFEKELRERILGMTSHATITGLSNRLTDWHGMQTRLAGEKDVIGSAPYVQFEAMLNRDSLVSGAIITGILPEEENKVSEIHNMMKAGGSLSALTAGEYGIVLGKDLAFSLGVGVDQKVTVITPQAAVTPAGILPRLRRFTVVGIFDSGMYEYDRGTAYVHMADAAKLFQMGDDVSGLRLKLTELFDAPLISYQIQQKLGLDYWITDWTKRHANFFKAVNTEKKVMFIILMLIVLVAAFNIVSTLVMLVTDKQSDIAILRTLGLTPRQVMGIFIVQGALIGMIGTLLGVVGGVLLASNVETIVPAIERLFHTKFLSPDVYPISELPSDLRLHDVVRIAVAAFAISLLATLYPAWQASRTHPAEALRYE
jgi:lipoprotein-releasing system permease protein